MKLVAYPSRDDWSGLLERPSDDQSRVEKIVKPILDKVVRGGDRALKKFALEYDHVELDNLLATEDELGNAKKQVGKQLKAAIVAAKENIEKFHDFGKSQIN